MAGFSGASLSAETARGLQRGDMAAFESAYRCLAPKVMGMAQRILGDRGLAEEVVQDTFVSLMEQSETLRNADAAVGWVRRTAVNHCLMRLRSPWQQRRLDGPAMERLVDGAEARESGERSHALLDLELALSSIGSETRMVLWLHDVEGYTHREIGALFGKTSSFSKSQLARGHERLKQTYGGNRHDGQVRDGQVRSVNGRSR
jgi:RNA polymerase sigma-70 factor (ECF subfamily)